MKRRTFALLAAVLALLFFVAAPLVVNQAQALPPPCGTCRQQTYWNFPNECKYEPIDCLNCTYCY